MKFDSNSKGSTRFTSNLTSNEPIRLRRKKTINKHKSTSNLKTIKQISNDNLSSLLDQNSLNMQTSGYQTQLMDTSNYASHAHSTQTQAHRTVNPSGVSNATRPEYIPGFSRCKSHKTFANGTSQGGKAIIPKLDFQKKQKRQIKRIKSSKMLAKKTLEHEDEGDHYFSRKRSSQHDSQYGSINPANKSVSSKKEMNSYKKMVRSIFKEKQTKGAGVSGFKNSSETSIIMRNKSISNFNDSVFYHRRKQKKDIIERFVRNNNPKTRDDRLISKQLGVKQSRFKEDSQDVFDTECSNQLFTQPGHFQLQESALPPIAQNKLHFSENANKSLPSRDNPAIRRVISCEADKERAKRHQLALEGGCA